jgi:hypothetical protein
MPIVYASDGFYSTTGYTSAEVSRSPWACQAAVACEVAIKAIGSYIQLRPCR